MTMTMKMHKTVKIQAMRLTWDAMYKAASEDFRKDWEAYQMNGKKRVIREGAEAYFIDAKGWPWYVTSMSARERRGAKNPHDEGLKLLHKIDVISMLSSAPFQMVSINPDEKDMEMFFTGEFIDNRASAASMCRQFKNIYFTKVSI